MITSTNPYTGETLAEFQPLTMNQVLSKLETAQAAFVDQRKRSFADRSKLMQATANLLKKNAREYAKIITLEMGKPITQAIAEVEKCAWVCEHYAEHAEDMLANRVVDTDARKSYVAHDPMGLVLVVMPWNYPLWQVFRWLAPGLMAGNVGVLKHSSNTMQCAELMERIVTEAGWPIGCFQNLVVSSNLVPAILEDERIVAATLTGSKAAGSAVASKAGSEIKKTVLELGGNNALVVFDDCDLDATVQTCVKARFQNTGQSCIAGKRLLLQEGIYEEFLKSLEKQVGELVSGDPMDDETYIGVMAREDLAVELEQQLQLGLQQGAKLLLGGNREGTYFQPTVVTHVDTDNVLFTDETFGPLLAVTKFKTNDEALDLVNQSKFGLGCSLFTQDLDMAEKLARKIDDGAVFINSMVKSDPRLPFGGTGISGYGRELSDDGIMEFVNRKTIYIQS